MFTRRFPDMRRQLSPCKEYVYRSAQSSAINSTRSRSIRSYSATNGTRDDETVSQELREQKREKTGNECCEPLAAISDIPTTYSSMFWARRIGLYGEPLDEEPELPPVNRL